MNPGHRKINGTVALLTGTAAVALVALVAGCGGGDTGGNATAAALPKTSSGSPATVGVASTELGDVLVDSDGRTIYLFDKDQRLVYRGQFDDSRPGNKLPVTGKDVRAAIDAVLGGQPVPSLQKPSIGCNIKWKPGAAPDYFG